MNVLRDRNYGGNTRDGGNTKNEKHQKDLGKHIRPKTQGKAKRRKKREKQDHHGSQRRREDAESSNTQALEATPLHKKRSFDSRLTSLHSRRPSLRHSTGGPFTKSVIPIYSARHFIAFQAFCIALHLIVSASLFHSHHLLSL